MATAKKAPTKTAAPTKTVASAKKAAPAKVAPVAAPVQVAPASEAPAKKRTANAAFMKPLTPSKELAAVIGAAPVPRTEVVKQLWVYIKKHALQDTTNKRMINADAKLKLVFGKPQVSMFEMAGLIGKHLK